MMNYASQSISFILRRVFQHAVKSYNMGLSEGRRAADFYRPRPGLNLRTFGPVASTLTTRPPKTTEYMHACTKAHTHTHTYIYIYTHTYTHARARTHPPTHTHTRKRTHRHTHTHTHTHIHTYIHTTRSIQNAKV
jgi:hypothetical protein